MSHWEKNGNLLHQALQLRKGPDLAQRIAQLEQQLNAKLPPGVRRHLLQRQEAQWNSK